MGRGSADLSVEQTACCIVGAGPAGAMLAYLLARQGVPVVLLEAHGDFEREFRGDTLHPGVMENLQEVGLAGKLLGLRHTEVRIVGVQTGNGTLRVDLGAGFRFWRTKFPYITVIAQSRFLEFITEEAKRYPTFRLVMNARVNELIREGGAVRGVRYEGPNGQNDRHEIRAAVTVGADGRFSRVRKLAGAVPFRNSPTVEVLWFRLSRRPNDSMESLGSRIGRGLFVVFIDRFDYWQMGCVVPKGSYQQLHAAGITSFHRSLARAMPEMADRVDELQEWKQISVLSFESSRVERWHRPGLLLIGDAAHVMSPVGGVGINYAIQDAVVASNLLGGKLKAGVPIQACDLAKVQSRRELPTRVIQAFQTLAQRVVMARLKGFRAVPGAGPGSGALDSFTPPLIVRTLLRSRLVLALPARFIGWGLWPPHVRTGGAKKTRHK